MPPMKLDIATGQLSDDAGRPVVFEQSIPPMQTEVMELLKEGTSIEEVLSAIDSHPDIEDKESLKQFAQSQVTK